MAKELILKIYGVTFIIIKSPQKQIYAMLACGKMWTLPLLESNDNVKKTKIRLI